MCDNIPHSKATWIDTTMRRLRNLAMRPFCYTWIMGEREYHNSPVRLLISLDNILVAEAEIFVDVFQVWTTL